MPKTSYAVTHAIAVGDKPELMGLKVKQNNNLICGQVYKLSCKTGNMGSGEMGTPVEAVVVSSCDIGSGGCGIDMISKTWDSATDNAQHGLTKCTVELTSTNPMSGSGPQCFIRPSHGDGKSNAWYSSVGLFNTAGKMATSARLNGKACTRNGISAYWDCTGFSSPLDDTSQFIVTYENGETDTVRYGTCQVPSGAQIFK